MAQNTCVLFEIPVTDLERAHAFYSAVLGRDLARSDDEPNPMVAFTDMSDAGVSGHLYPGTPAAAGSGPTIHLAAFDGLDATAARVREAGGTVVSEPIEIPLGLVAYSCRSFESIMCSKGDDPWAQARRMNFERMRCGSH